MDEKDVMQEEPRERYTPRPWWQVAGAWLGLVLFICSAVLMFLYTMRLFQ